MSEFTAPTGERAEKILQAARDTLAAGQTIGGGRPEVWVMREKAGLEDISTDERDWAFEQIQAEQAAAAEQQEPDAQDGDHADAQDSADPDGGEEREPYQGPPVHCAACDVDVDPEDLEGPTEEGKVYVNHHGAREGVPIPDEGPVVAFESMAG